MNIFFRTLVAAAWLGGASFPASATVAGIEGPWSVLVAGKVPWEVTDGYFVPVLVSSLDGETPSTYSVTTKPGKKQLVLDTTRATNTRGPSYKRLELDMAPCMRYFVAGKKSAPASLRWAPEVFRVEPIGECMAEFKLNDTAVVPAPSPAPATK